VVNVAWPELNVPVPSVVKPSLKTTVPDGVPDPGALAVTVAVKVTDCPDTDGLADEETAILLPHCLMVCVTTPEMLGSKKSLPL
jgi:hypothetical protein